jgi:hypothetical protein
MTIDQTITVYSGDKPDKDTMTPEQFDVAAQDWVDYQVEVAPELNTWAGEANSLKTTMNGYKTDAEAAEAIATGAANYVGEWSDQTGAATVPYGVTHNNALWILKEDVADVTLSEPSSTNTDWFMVITVKQPTVSTASAATVDLGTSLRQLITGTTDITAFNGVAGVTYHCRTEDTLLLTYNATDLITQTGEDIKTMPGDTFDVYMVSSDKCRIENYKRAVWPMFSVRLGEDQDLVRQEYSLLNFNTIVYDTDNTFDTSNKRHVPSVPGNYQYAFNVGMVDLEDGDLLVGLIYKNGLVYLRHYVRPGSGGNLTGVNMLATIPMNGSTDYVDFYVYHDNASTQEVSSASSFTRCFGHLVA